MKGWKSERAQTVVTFKTGKFDSNAAEEDGKYPFFTCAAETYRINKYAFDTECVLLAGNNAAGIFPLKYFKGKFNAYQRTYIIESKDPSVIIPRFIFESFKLYLKSFEQTATGATTKFLTMGILNNLWLPLPPLPVQRKIAAVLSAYDDLIENNKRRIAILEQMAEELYREWFVRLRFPGHEKVKIVKGVPEGWEVRKVGDSFTFLGGGTPATEVSTYWTDGTVQWYSPTDLTAAKSMFSISSKNKITELGLKESAARLFPPYSIMMTSRATIGVLSINTTRACTNQGFITCIPNESIPVSFLFFWLKLNREYFIQLSNGSTFLELTKGRFKTIDFLIPEKKIMREYCRMQEPIFSQIEGLLRHTNNLSTTRDRLLSRLMSGKIDVENIDIAFPKSMVEDGA